MRPILKFFVVGLLWGAELAAPALPWIPVHAEDGPLIVEIDRASILPLPDNVAAIVQATPNVVKVTRVAGAPTAVLTGISFGDATLKFLNRNGDVLSSRIVRVVGDQDQSITAYSGGARATIGNCEHVYATPVPNGDQPNRLSPSGSTGSTPNPTMGAKGAL